MTIKNLQTKHIIMTIKNLHTKHIIYMLILILFSLLFFQSKKAAAYEFNLRDTGQAVASVVGVAGQVKLCYALTEYGCLAVGIIKAYASAKEQSRDKRKREKQKERSDKLANELLKKNGVNIGDCWRFNPFC